MKIFFLDLKEHARKIINNEKEDMIPLSKEEKKIHRVQRKVIYSRKRFSTNDDNKNYFKVKDHCHYTGKYRAAAHSICNLRYKTPKEVPVEFHNGSTHDLKDNLNVWEKIQKNHITFSVPIKK